MWKLLVIIGMIPVVAAVIARQLARVRGGRRELQGAPAADELAADLLKSGGSSAMVKAVGRLALPAGPNGPLRLPKECLGERDAGSLGIVVQEVGFHLLGAEMPEETALRRRVLRFGAAGPAFAAMIAVFAMIAMRGYFGWVLGAVALIAGLASMLNLLTTGIEVRGAARGASELRRLGLRLRRDDWEEIERSAQAAAWRRVLPASLAWILP